MFRVVLRLLLTALAFCFLLPLIPGIDFHGDFGAALIIAVLFAVMSFFVDLAAVLLSAVLTISSLGMALLWIIPLWVLGFWLLPAVALMAVSDFLPGYLTVNGWMAAIGGGLVMLLVGAITSSIPTQRTD